MTAYTVAIGQTAAGAALFFQDTQNVYGAANLITINFGAQQDVYGTVDSTIINDGEQFVHSGGVATNTTNNGGNQDVSLGGLATNTTINLTGEQDVYGTADVTVINSGYQYVESGGLAIHTTVNLWQYVESGGLANSTTIDSAGEQLVYSGGAAINTTINYGIQYVDSGGNATNTTINGTGFLGAFQDAYGTVTNTTINSNGVQYIFSGGAANNTIINEGGEQHVLAGGTANNTAVYGGFEEVGDGGTGNGTTINNGGRVDVYGTVQNTVINAGLLDLWGTATGAISFGDGATLRIEQVIFGNFAAPLVNLGIGDAIDLRGLPFVAGHVPVLSGSLLTVSNGFDSIQFTLITPQATNFVASDDGHLGTILKATPLVVTETLSHDTGSSSSDNITSNPALTGSGRANAVVSFTVDGAAIAGTATADASGIWTFTPTGLADGAHSIVAGETDLGGNTRTVSLSFTLDTTAPALTERLANDTGSSSTDRITSNPTLSGTGDVNAVVHFTVDGTVIAATATADASGAWSFAPSGLADGTHTVVASETDAAGNTGTASLNLTFDTQLSAHNDAYMVLPGHTLSTTTLDGVLLNDQTLSLATASLLSGPAHGELLFGPDGNFSFTPTVGFTGIDSFTYRATDMAGVTSDAQALLYIVPVNAGVTTTLDLLALSAEEQVASTYIAYFGRGADAAGFNYWVNEFQQGGAAVLSNIASEFAPQVETETLYPFMAHPQGASDAQVSTFLDSVYHNLFNRSGDAGGLAYWTAEIQATIAAGQGIGSVLITIMNGAQGGDITTLMGKVAVGLEYVHQQEQLGTSWSGAQDGASSIALLHAVTADPASVLMGIKQADLLIHADVH